MLNEPLIIWFLTTKKKYIILFWAKIVIPKALMKKRMVVLVFPRKVGILKKLAS